MNLSYNCSLFNLCSVADVHYRGAAGQQVPAIDQGEEKERQVPVGGEGHLRQPHLTDPMHHADRASAARGSRSIPVRTTGRF